VVFLPALGKTSSIKAPVAFCQLSVKSTGQYSQDVAVGESITTTASMLKLKSQL